MDVMKQKEMLTARFLYNIREKKEPDGLHYDFNPPE